MDDEFLVFGYTDFQFVSLLRSWHTQRKPADPGVRDQFLVYLELLGLEYQPILNC
jgi:hypothetical protein